MQLATSRWQDFTPFLWSCWLCLYSAMSAKIYIELLNPQISIHCVTRVWDGDKGYLVQVFVTAGGCNF